MQPVAGVLYFEEPGKTPWMKIRRQPLTTEKGKDAVYLKNSRENHSHADTLALDFWSQNP